MKHISIPVDQTSQAKPSGVFVQEIERFQRNHSI